MKQPFRICVVLLATAIGCGREAPVRPGEPVAVHNEVVLGPRTTRVIGQADTVRAYRVLSPFAPHFEQSLRQTRGTIDDYVILEEAPVRPEQARRIADLLLNPSTYDPRFASACSFDPGYALRFQRGRDAVVVAICFKCSDLDVVPSASIAERRTTQPFGTVAEPFYSIMTGIFETPQKTAG